MNHRPLRFTLAAALTLWAGAAFAQNQPIDATVTVDADAAGTPLSPELYGVFFEDINFAADGGLYGELLQNRSFEYYPFRATGMAAGEKPGDYNAMTAWTPVRRGASEGNEDENRRRRWDTRVSIDRPLNANNTHYLDITLRGEGETGVANSGYDGITVRAGQSYNLSLFARGEGESLNPLKVALETEDGAVLAEAQLPAPGADWAQAKTTLIPQRDADNARLVITTTGQGRISLDVVSLMPQDTFMNRENGLRRDLAQAIADLHPGTLRFPGGCIVHGNGLEESYRWKDTVGPIEQRRGNSNRWGYHQTYGLGYFEYFQFAEDVGAEPLPILPVGVSCGFEPPYETVRPEELHVWIQDVIDLVEFANGPVDSEWGKVRAEMGHPEPFNLKYIGLGNEEHDTALFRQFYPQFVKALREAHPEITIVGTSGLSPGIPAYGFMDELDVPITDEHYYERPEWFIDNRTRFDDFKRGGPKVYVGEYASRGNTLFNALSEATYLTGIERNGDLVVMSAYAPLLARHGHTQWNQANLIHFDADQVIKTPNYYVQQMFSQNKGDRWLPSEVSVDAGGENAPLLATSVTQSDAGLYHVKLVNPTETPMTVTVKLDGAGDLAGEGERTLLTGPRDAANDRDNPQNVAPQTSTIPVGAEFQVEAPAYSVQVIRVPVK